MEEKGYDHCIVVWMFCCCSYYVKLVPMSIRLLKVHLLLLLLLRLLHEYVVYYEFEVH